MVLELQYTRGSKVLTHQFQGFFRQACCNCHSRNHGRVMASWTRFYIYTSISDDP